ncbi:MAG: hypothetical protein M8350_09120 [Methanosarcinaceae archaeon]|nr:hypothetical protein [Methanosarcinaceae archaeon]
MGSGGNTWSGAQSINVPDGWSDLYGRYTRDVGSGSGDWFRFAANDNDGVYVDIQASFVNNYNGELLLYKAIGVEVAHLSSSSNDHYGIVNS